MAERKEITTKCHNCGRDSFLDLNCADCTRAFNRGQEIEYNKWKRKCKEHSEDGHEFCDKCFEYGKKEERKRIYGFLKKRNFHKLAREFNKGD